MGSAEARRNVPAVVPSVANNRYCRPDPVCALKNDQEPWSMKSVGFELTAVVLSLIFRTRWGVPANAEAQASSARAHPKRFTPSMYLPGLALFDSDQWRRVVVIPPSYQSGTGEPIARLT